MWSIKYINGRSNQNVCEAYIAQHWEGINCKIVLQNKLTHMFAFVNDHFIAFGHFELAFRDN